MIMEDARWKKSMMPSAILIFTPASTRFLSRPFDFLEECRKHWETAQSSFRKTIERKIGNTWYVIETECDGNEPLADKVKRLIFSDKGVIC